MEDLISRKAVLDLVVANHRELNGLNVVMYSPLYKDIKQLPPVQPIRPKGKWIPVSERLPEENKTVIASTEDGVYPETKYTEKYGWEWAYESGADYWVELKEVKAWMPLPEPYVPDINDGKMSEIPTDSEPQERSEE